MTVLHCTRPARMGALASKKRARLRRKWSWSGSPGDHSPYPLDCVPYPGNDLIYCFLDIMTSYKVIENDVNLGPRGVTTDTSVYLGDLQCCYEEGFVLNQFVRVPGLRSTTVLQDWGEKVPYQAILSKPVTRDESRDEMWELHVEKQILSIKTLATDEFPQEHDMLQTVAEFAARGARLVCAVPIGFVRSNSPNDQYTVMGVDLFFNIPHHPTPTIYSYHAIRLPVRYYVVPDVTQTIQQIDCDADWMGQMKLFLDQGWKLVDISIDTTALADAFGMKTASKKVDSIWLFEKEKRLEKDTTPMFEGVIIEYLHKVKMGKGGEFPCKDWRPVIAGMGVSGWELCTILQTPFLVQSTFTTYTMKLLMVFQRPIFSGHQDLSRETRERMGNKPILKYNRYGVSRSLPRDFLQATGTSGTKGYYNQLLKRFVYDDEPGDDTKKTDSPSFRRSVSSPAGSADAGGPRTRISWSSDPPSYHSPSPSGSSQVSSNPRQSSLQSSSLATSGSSSLGMHPGSPGSQTSSFPSTPSESSTPRQYASPSTSYIPGPGSAPVQSQPPYFPGTPQLSSSLPPDQSYRQPFASLPSSPATEPRHPGQKRNPGLPFLQIEANNERNDQTNVEPAMGPAAYLPPGQCTEFTQRENFLPNSPSVASTTSFPGSSSSEGYHHSLRSNPLNPAVHPHSHQSSAGFPTTPQTPSFTSPSWSNRPMNTLVPISPSNSSVDSSYPVSPSSGSVSSSFPSTPPSPYGPRRTPGSPGGTFIHQSPSFPNTPSSPQRGPYGPQHVNFPTTPPSLEGGQYTQQPSLFPHTLPSSQSSLSGSHVEEQPHFVNTPSSPQVSHSGDYFQQPPQFPNTPPSPQVLHSPPVEPQFSSAPPSPVVGGPNRPPPPIPLRRSSLSAMPHRVPHRPPAPRRQRSHLPMANGYVPTGTGGTTYIRPAYSNRVYHSGVR